VLDPFYTIDAFKSRPTFTNF